MISLPSASSVKSRCLLSFSCLYISWILLNLHHLMYFCPSLPEVFLLSLLGNNGYKATWGCHFERLISAGHWRKSKADCRKIWQQGSSSSHPRLKQPNSSLSPGGQEACSPWSKQSSSSVGVDAEKKGWRSHRGLGARKEQCLDAIWELSGTKAHDWSRFALSEVARWDTALKIRNSFE